MAGVSFEEASRIYKGADVPAVDRLDLAVDDGEFAVLVGPSGSGKSTALRMLAGLEGIDEGSVRIGERDVTRLPPKERNISMVFQNYALYPHMTAAENIGYHLKIAKRPKDEIRRKVLDAAKLLGLEEFLGQRPSRLSGGQRQRVAMGRAIVSEPQVFLMDEPLSNLDATLRVMMRAEVAALQRKLGATMIYVTHDQVEAMTMGDRVAVLDHGVLQQFDTPLALYERPANTFVAGFVGTPAMNLITAPVDSDGCRLGGLLVRLTAEQRAELTGSDVVVGVRPEGFDVTPPGTGLDATVWAFEETGSASYLHATVAVGASEVAVVGRAESRSRFSKGSALGFVVKPGQAHVFDPSTGVRLSGPPPEVVVA